MTSCQSLPRRWSAAVLVCSAIAAAGCGGGSEDAGPVRSGSPPTLATVPEGDEEQVGGGAGGLGVGQDDESAAGIYSATTGALDPSVADIPPMVYVPNSAAGTVSIIDPESYEVVAEHSVGIKPHHVTPSWDMQTLYALDTAGNFLIPFDPYTAEPGEPLPVEDPYNLYFTPDGEMAVVVAERYSRIDLLDGETWEVLGSVHVPHAGVNHGDFSADGRYFYASTEWSGWVVKVDLEEQTIVEENHIGVEPIDVKLSPDGEVLFVADQDRHGVFVLDADDLTEIDFLPTERGAHGLYFSRDVTQLYVSNRLAGSVSVIDVDSRKVVDTWEIPGEGSPDMGGISIDGSELWLSGRYHGEVYVFDTETGELLHRIPTGDGAHGLAYYPQPGRYSIGHTGVMR